MRTIFFLLGLGIIAMLVVLRAADPYPVAVVRTLYFDFLQQIAPREPADLPVRVVDIDEASLAQIGQWPWPRDQLAALVTRLQEYGAAVVAFDVLFPEADRMSGARIGSALSSRGLLAPGVGADQLAALDTDRQFAEAIASVPVVLSTSAIPRAEGTPPTPKAGFAEIGLSPSLGLPVVTGMTPLLPQLADAATGLGSMNMAPGGDISVVRTVPLLWRSEAGIVPTLGIEALRVALGADTFVLVGSPDLEGFTEALRLGDFTIPLTPDGQMWVHYRPDDPSLYVPAHAVLAPGDDPELRAKIEGQIVFVGTSAAGLLDIRETALGQSVPGVSIHAQIIEQILTGDFLQRTGAAEGLEIVILVALGLIVLSVMSLAGPMASILAGFAAGLCVVAGSWLSFRQQGILLDATFPLAGGFFAFSALAAWQFVVADREKRQIRKSFSHYVAPTVLSQIERSGHRLELGGETRPITVMFCDMRNFTPLSATMTPTELVTLLNRHFTGLGEDILSEQGTIDKFIGDAVMAFWNAPVETPDHAARAARAALRMRATVAKGDLAEAGRKSGRDGPQVEVAIGIATGPALVGNVGSRDRFNYSVVGDTVNLAARIETSCRHVDYDIVLSATTAAEAQNLALLDAGHLALKGVAEQTPAAILVGDEAVARSEGFRALSAAHGRLIARLAAGEPAERELAECRRLGAEVEPGLARFYARVPERTADYAALGAAGEMHAAAV